MSDIVECVLELDVAEGKLDDLRVLMQEMSDASRADGPGTLAYEWYIDAISSICHIFERYADSAAVMANLRSFGTKFADQFMAVLTPTAITVYGPAWVQMQATPRSYGKVQYGLLGGFHR